MMGRMAAPVMACRINSAWLMLQAESLSANSAYSSSVMRVLTTRLRCGVLYRFRMVKPPSAVRGVLSLIGEKQGVKRNCF